MGFPFLFNKNIPEPRRAWLLNDKSEHISQSVLVNSKWKMIVFSVLYFLFNIYIVIDNLVSTKISEHIKGWVYIVIIAWILVAGTVYYYATIGLTMPNMDIDGSSKHPNRSVLCIAGVQPKLIVQSDYAQESRVRKSIKISIPADVRISSTVLCRTLLTTI